jgi:hypothetical protein
MEDEGLDEPAGISLERAGLRGAARRRALDPGLVESLIARAEAQLGQSRAAAAGRAHWIAGTPLALGGSGGRGERPRLAWAYRGDTRSLELPASKAEATAAALRDLSRSPEGRIFYDLASALALPPEAMAELRSAGLLVV